MRTALLCASILALASAFVPSRGFNAARVAPRAATRDALTMMPLGIPKVAYKIPGAQSADWIDIYNRLYRERIIFLGQEIDDEIANQVRARVCDARMKRESLNTRRARADHRGDAVSRLRER